jgi:hypothetical protein
MLGVRVAVGVAVMVGVRVAVGVRVTVGVLLGIGEGVGVPVGIKVGVCVGDGLVKATVGEESANCLVPIDETLHAANILAINNSRENKDMRRCIIDFPTHTRLKMLYRSWSIYCKG